jgi:hypothetical protein
LKNIFLKCDLFEIISDKINNLRNLRTLSFFKIENINEKSFNIFFKNIYGKSLNFLLLEKLNIGELFLNLLIQIKNKFPNLLSFTFKPIRKINEGISLISNFLMTVKSLYEFKMNIINIDDFYKLDDVLTDFRFIKFEIE